MSAIILFKWRDKKRDMEYGILTKLIISKGVDNVNVPESIKQKTLLDVGTILFKEGSYEEAGKAFAKAGLEKELLAGGDWLSQQGRFRDAAYFYKFSKDQKRIEACAHECMNQGAGKEAKMLFEILGNKNMLLFLQENFGV